MAPIALSTTNLPKSAPHETTSSLPISSLTSSTATCKGPAKPASHQLQVPSLPIRSQSPDTLSLVSTDDFSELRRVHSSSFAAEDAGNGTTLPKYQASTRGWRGSLSRFWVRNKGLALVLLAQVFGAMMNIGTRLLENESEMEGGGMHPFQIIFVRMSVTMVLSVLYMWFTKTPDFPFGSRDVRALLVARGLGGFFGVFGIYWSLQYLPLADATVLTFLAPFIACFVCAKILHEPFTRAEQIGGLVSLTGVVLIARPTSFFSSAPVPAPAPNAPAPTIAPATPTQRLEAVGVAMLGVVGAAIAFTTIRMIGTRAHPLISVNYFATWCTIVSGTMLLAVPGIPFILPRSAKEVGLLTLIGVGGFVLQFLLTAGLSYERSSRATNMVYSQMLFALAADRAIWGVVPGWWSLAGSALILSSAIVVAVQKEGMVGGDVGGEGGAEAEMGRTDEEVALVGIEVASDEESEEEEGSEEEHESEEEEPKEEQRAVAEGGSGERRRS